MVRVVRLERTVSWSQTRRDTNFAIPGYLLFSMIPRRAVKIKLFLSVVIPVVKGDFVPFSATGEKPAIARAARLCELLSKPRMDRVYGTPKASALPTALHPDTVFTLHRKSVFDSPNSILDFGRKVNRPVAYPARIAYNKNITQYIKERAL